MLNTLVLVVVIFKIIFQSLSYEDADNNKED